MISNERNESFDVCHHHPQLCSINRLAIQSIRHVQMREKSAIYDKNPSSGSTFGLMLADIVANLQELENKISLSHILHQKLTLPSLV